MYVHSRYQQFVQCLEDVLSSCTVSTKLLYQGVRDAYDFICNDGFDGQYQSVNMQTEMFRFRDQTGLEVRILVFASP